MAETSTTEGYDAAGFLEFQLSVGAVETRSGERVLVLPDALLRPLFESGEARAALATQLAAAVTQAVPDPSGASPETLGTALRGVFAVHGLGFPTLERWGSGLVLRWEVRPSCVEDDAAAAMLTVLFEKVAGADLLVCEPVGDDRFLMIAASHADRVRSLRQEGLGLGAILDRFVGGTA